MKRELLDNGNIWQKSDGRWIGMVRYKDEFGVAQRKSFSSKKKKTLQAKMTEYVKNFNEQVASSDESRKPLKESMKNWLRVYKYPEVERTTYDRYECTAEHQIYPYIGNKPVGDVTPADIKKLLTKHMNNGYAFTTSKKAYSLLKMFFKQLFQEGAIPNNPMAMIDMTKKDNYGAFHNTTHHPHIHLVIFSKGQEGFLSEKGIKELRRTFGQDIFRDEQYKLATIETGYRNELKDNLAELLQQIQARQSLSNADYYLFLLQKIKDELQQQKGKKLYGYLPRKMKRLVDFALHEFAKDDILSEIYAKWNEVNREKLSLYYDTKDKPAVPIERNPELRSLKNMLIRTALGINYYASVAVNTARIGFLFSMLAKQIVSSAGKRLDELNKIMPKSDSKERNKIRAKKLAHGQKESSDSNGIDDEAYDSQAPEGILTMLDYLISLGNQENEQDSEVDTMPEESYDFDNAYAAYLNDEDDGYDEDEEEYFGLSM